MRQPGRRRWFRWVLVGAAVLAVAGYLGRDFLFFTFLYRGTPADWELSQLGNERERVRDELSQLKRSGKSAAEIDAARERAMRTG